MRVGLIADIHGNLPALDAVLADLEGEQVDITVCLGDVAATGPFPVESIRRVRELDPPVVKGNTDAFLLEPGPSDTDDENVRRIEEIDRWCAEQLSAADLDFLAGFQPTVDVPLGDDANLLCFHGSPRSYDHIISATTPDEDLDLMLNGQRATVLAGGHWHFQLLRRHQDMLLINPGSIGLAYDVSPDGEVRVPARAEYAVLSWEDGRLGVDLRRVPYDRDVTVRAMFERDMPHAEWWSAGWR